MAGWLLVACAVLSAAPLHAQADAEPQQSTQTLHVYVDHMQVPTLVLNASHHPAAPVAREQFTVVLEGMPPFQPLSARRQGDDPLALAVLVDKSNPEDERWQRLPQAMDALAKSLSPHDRVQLHVLDGCALRRLGPDNSPGQQSLHARSVAAVALPVYKPGADGQPACPQPATLWPAVQSVAAQLALEPGRRALLVIGGGAAPGSASRMEAVERVLNVEGVALFGVQPPEPPPASAERGGRSVSMNMMRLRAEQEMAQDAHADAARQKALFDLYATECKRSGGLLLAADERDLPHVMAETVSLLRSRYILEFRRPNGMTPGPHGIAIQDGRPHDILLPAGASAPIADPDDATVVDKPEEAPPQK